MSNPGASAMSYVLGPDNRIIAVNPAWNEFAADQGAEELTGEQVIGKPMHECIADPATRQICNLLYDAARKARRPITVPFRCDSADVRRFMSLTITPLSEGLLRMSTELIREELRSPVAILDPTKSRTVEVLTICSWCKRIPLPSGAWVDVEDAMVQLGMLQRAALPLLTHGVCPQCSAVLLAEIAALQSGGQASGAEAGKGS